MSMPPPRIGQEFVWLEGGPGWCEVTYQVADVIEHVGLGMYRIEYGEPGATLPEVFRKQFGENCGKARMYPCVVEYRHGRWRRAALRSTPEETPQ